MFVLALGYSRKAVHLLTLQSSTRVRAELHEPAFRRLGGTRAPWSSTTRRGRAQPDIYDPALKSAVSRSACPLRRCRADLPGPGGSTAWKPKSTWSKRCQQINGFEHMLSESGVRIIKFLLHISKEEQAGAGQAIPRV